MPGFVFTSDDPPPDGWFDGYCFVGADYIFGEEGARAYARARGRPAPGGEDGRYATARRDGDRFIFSCDFGGYDKLWYLHMPDFWLVSNSIGLAAQAMRRRGVAIEPNRAQLSRLALARHFFNQQCSLRSIIDGLRLVPIGCDLSIGPDAACVAPRPDPAASADYAECLAALCGTWTSRLATLLSRPEFKLSVNLSGGLDSRATFAIAERARIGLARDALARLTIRSYGAKGAKVDRDDLDVAGQIAAELGIELNRGLGIPRARADAAFAAWYQTSLGCYDVLHVPTTELDPFDVSIGGGGGESNRTYYADKGVRTVDDLVRKYHENIPDARVARALEDEVREGMDFIGSISPAGSDPMVLYYRHFRARFHGGRKPQINVSFTPLASRASVACLRASGDERVKNSQLHYDIFQSLMPRLLEIPFDLDKKTPSARVRRLLSRAEWTEITPGEVFAPAPNPSQRRRNGARPVDVFAEAFRVARTSGFTKDFLGAGFIDAASQLMDAGIAGRKFADPFDAKPVGSVITCALFDMPELTEAALRGDLPSA